MAAKQLESPDPVLQALDRATAIVREFRDFGRTRLYDAYHRTTQSRSGHARLCLRILIHYATTGGSNDHR